MCRSIKVLRNADPPVTGDEVAAAALQYVRKVSGYHRPSKANEQVFETAVQEVAEATSRLLAHLQSAPGSVSRRRPAPFADNRASLVE